MIKQAKSLRDTYIFSIMNKDGYIDKKVKLFASDSALVVTPQMLEVEVATINKTFKYPAKMAVLEAFRNGHLRPVVLKQGVHDKMPISIPFLVNKDRTAAMVFIDNYTRMDKEGNLSIDYKKFYCLMESAYLSMEGIKRNNTTVISRGSEIFAHMFTKVLNKKFSLNSKRDAMNKVIYLASKFFMINHLGMTDQNMISNYAIKNCNSATAILVRDVDTAFTPEMFTNISTFLKGLADLSYLFIPGFETITTRDYMTSYADTYGQSTIYSLESLEYFLFVISSVVIGAYLNNQTLLEDIIDKDGAKLYLELGR